MEGEELPESYRASPISRSHFYFNPNFHADQYEDWYAVAMEVLLEYDEEAVPAVRMKVGRSPAPRITEARLLEPKSEPFFAGRFK